MDYKTRFNKTLKHQKPDRVPMDFAGTTLTQYHNQFLKKFMAYHDLSADTEEDALEKIMDNYDIDFRKVGTLFRPITKLTDFSRKAQGFYTDCWGIKRMDTGMYWDIYEYPLKNATFDEIKNFPWPSAKDIDMDDLKKETEKAKRLYYDSDHVIVCNHPVYGYFEMACWMFSFDDFLYRMAAEPEVAYWFFENFHKYVTDVNEIYYASIGRYVHMTTSGDDFGMQAGPFMSPDMFKECIAPWYKKRIEQVKSICNIPYFHHSCGSVFKLLDTIIDMGVDILNPIQPGTQDMEPEKLKNAFGDRITFWGGIDEQHLLAKGTPEEIKKEVRRIVDIMGKNGGYGMAASHNIQPDVPCENVDAMLTAFR
jgi:uroporphyrinogen decarboxylase